VALRVTPFLMFEGRAKEAMEFYVSLFPGAKIIESILYGRGEPGPEGTIKMATFTVGTQVFRCIDSAVKHEFSFTPAFSIFVDCESEEQLARFTSALSEGGKIFMPLDNYGFSRKFAWVGDRFGVSWQLNLP
jgi:predicted 3-demethylubiquinone-9 3-methyltransferase (glyoxalase superfamily)